MQYWWGKYLNVVGIIRTVYNFQGGVFITVILLLQFFILLLLILINSSIPLLVISQTILVISRFSLIPAALWVWNNPSTLINDSSKTLQIMICNNANNALPTPV